MGGRNPRDGLRGPGSKADMVIDVCMPNIKELFVDKYDVTFATISVNNRLETIGIRRHKFKLWVRKVYYDEIDEVLPQQALESALGLFESKASYSDVKKRLSLRISDGLVNISTESREDVTPQEIINIQPTRIYYDLSNKQQQVVEITTDGWTIKEAKDVPQMFYRLQGQQPQVMPVKPYPGNIMDQFMDLINTVVKDSNGTELPEETQKMRLLLKCYVIVCIYPQYR